MTLHAELFNHSVAVALSSEAASPTWLKGAPQDFQQRIAAICNDILGSGIDLPLLVPCLRFESEPNSWTAVTLRRLFVTWVEGSGADIAAQLLSPDALAVSRGIQRWCFTPAADIDVIEGALSRQDSLLRQAWLLSLSDQAHRNGQSIHTGRGSVSASSVQLELKRAS